MSYLNIDTEIGIIGQGGRPWKNTGPQRGGIIELEIWGKSLRNAERQTIDDTTAAPFEEGEFRKREVGHWLLRVHTPPQDRPFADSAFFDELDAFRVENVEDIKGKGVTIVKDGKVIARNVQSYDSRPLLQRPNVQMGLGIAGVAIATGFVGRWLDWW